MKILDIRWFDTVGIVRLEHGDGEIRYYIKDVTGNFQIDDVEIVAQWGLSFPKAAGDVLFGVMPCLVYEDNILYGDKKSLDFVFRLIHNIQKTAVRRSAQVKG